MPAYAITATCVVAVSSVIVFLIFYRMKILNLRTLLSVALASLITALGLPALFSLVSSGMDGSFAFASPSVTLLVSVAAYLLIVVILSMIISFIINGAGSKLKKRVAFENGDPDKASAEDDNYLEQIFVNFIGEHEQSDAGSGNTRVQTAETDVIDGAAAQPDLETAVQTDLGTAVQLDPEAAVQPDLGTVAQPGLETAVQLDAETAAAEDVIHNGVVYPAGDDETAVTVVRETREAQETKATQEAQEALAAQETRETQAAQESPAVAANGTILSDNVGILANIDDNTAVVGNNLEISVDSNENIDKMGIENIVHNSNSLTIEDCINEAFRLKGAGDFESAILYHMYALDKKPCKELTFWTILDICVMYKSLGQQELALDIMNSYYETYGDTMDSYVKEEIGKNLTAVQA